MTKPLQYSRAWWAARLPIITAFAQGKDILVGGESDHNTMIEFTGPVSDYTIAPDPVELWVVLDDDGKVVAMQPNFGSADTVRAVKNGEHTDREGHCFNVHRVVHMKEVPRG